MTNTNHELEVAVRVQTFREEGSVPVLFDRTAAQPWVVQSLDFDGGLVRFSSLAAAMGYIAEFIVDTQF